MPVDRKKVFYGLIRGEFAPRLRELGFKGSGSNFCRVQGEVINTINIQGNKYGGSSAVNLGLHLTFLPVNWKDELPDLKKIKEVDCEFRNRLAPRGKHDYWWEYGDLFNSPSKQVRHLIETYLDVGEPAFSEYDTVEKVADMISLDQIFADNYIEAFGGITEVRAALTMARIHGYLGNLDLARQFAEAGITNLGRATALAPCFKEILGRS